MIVATSASPAAFRSQSATRAPWRLNASAVARPIPEAAPVTAATRSLVMVSPPSSSGSRVFAPAHAKDSTALDMPPEAGFLKLQTLYFSGPAGRDHRPAITEKEQS